MKMMIFKKRMNKNKLMMNYKINKINKNKWIHMMMKNKKIVMDKINS
jgi:hypothetical protein